jgi:hypothetical protein
MSASVQWVAMRTMETPRSPAALMSSAVPTPGLRRALAARGLRAA